MVLRSIMVGYSLEFVKKQIRKIKIKDIDSLPSLFVRKV